MRYLKKIFSNIKWILGAFLVTKFLGFITYNLVDTILINMGLINPSVIWFNIQLSYKHLIYDLFTGIREEVIFRYGLMDIILNRILPFSKLSSLILSSFIFGIAHFNNLAIGEPYQYRLAQVIMAGILGLLFGYIYYRKGLWLAILTHGFYNFSVRWNSDIQAICILLGALLSSILLVKYIIKKLRYKIYLVVKKEKKPYTRYYRRLKK